MPGYKRNFKRRVLNVIRMEAAKEKANKYQHTYANNHSISFLSAIFSTSGRINAEFLRLLFYHAHFFLIEGGLYSVTALIGRARSSSALQVS